MSRQCCLGATCRSKFSSCFHLESWRLQPKETIDLHAWCSGDLDQDGELHAEIGSLSEPHCYPKDMTKVVRMSLTDATHEWPSGSNLLWLSVWPSLFLKIHGRAYFSRRERCKACWSSASSSSWRRFSRSSCSLTDNSMASCKSLSKLEGTTGVLECGLLVR